MRAIFTMFRLPNLLIIALTFFFLRYLLFVPFYSQFSLILCMENGQYLLLIINTMLIAAAGYTINDYFDVVTDHINKPEKQYIGKQISAGTTLAVAILLSSISIVLALWLSADMHNIFPAILLLTALAVAWWYAVALKKKLLWGNIAVSCMSAGTIGMAWLIEKQCAVLPENASAQVTTIIIAISMFALFLSLMREIVKDIEDIEGDRLIQCRSLPIAKGIPITKKVLAILLTITFTMLLLVQMNLLQNSISFAAIWLFAAVEIPLVYFGYKLKTAQDKKDFHGLSSMLKWIMVGGILSMVAGQF